jgi:hypothetical protein
VRFAEQGAAATSNKQSARHVAIQPCDMRHLELQILWTQASVDIGPERPPLPLASIQRFVMFTVRP